MELFKEDKVYNFLGKGKIFFIASFVLFFISIALIATKGFSFGIDFTGGTVVQIKYTQDAPIAKIRESLKKSELFEHATVSEFGSSQEIVIKTPASTVGLSNDIGDTTKEILKDTGEFEIRRVDMVGPKVGDELRVKGLTAFLLTLLAIMATVTFRYEWRFALAAIIAIVHDIIITFGFVSYFEVDFNIESVAALLMILGYSIHDTIIVYDRVRENIEESKETDFVHVINEAVSRTQSRTTLTSLTVFFVVLTLYVFGGDIMLGFSFPMLVGVIIGTYSSIFVAAQLVVWTGFDVGAYRQKMAQKVKNRAEKEKMRSQFESGTL
ncbi:MAG: protein-export membrane protein SecF [Sulfurimonas sp. RIFCSPHIGHO2_12_FULL_36_9]|uniref:protein translocase subunit SecF n=1 Tax=unclassified Sulfurimonas TaxID=2623549 RepID=UPI0008D44E84|nr:MULTISPECIES: protein translocase subunit SecF [unclassified Sulfurimonas]OHD96484.1 MAG: protein-export membrane protein SecF [Sulfurimonas sp. RIFCSPHIGHO2_12_FULL_36_9]OHD99493.1 MAG: protein-export membrane protein SecF [Sulfurimonas sp. RIFCSPLOWO2_02_FULL_36_28]OHE00408.1 MAG: protein-export membrane protein SecF [Sulfurimonas sp. RIFCSPLOWO2_12_36_12]OHE07456.1 MAG: protein-export membrane protein SecF [Sulfurimonas sp. RIFCSPLOWO2_12_FULL_36_74]